MTPDVVLNPSCSPLNLATTSLLCRGGLGSSLPISKLSWGPACAQTHTTVLVTPCSALGKIADHSAPNRGPGGAEELNGASVCPGLGP